MLLARAIEICKTVSFALGPVNALIGLIARNQFWRQFKDIVLLPSVMRCGLYAGYTSEAQQV